MNRNEIKKETWKFLRNISIICFITTSIIIYVVIKGGFGTILATVLLWPLTIILPIILLLSIITFIISLFKIRKHKKLRSETTCMIVL